MFTLIHQLDEDEVRQTLQYYHTAHKREFFVPPGQIKESQIYLDHFNILREPLPVPVTANTKTRLNISNQAFTNKRQSSLKAGHFILESIADSPEPNPSPAFLIALLHTGKTPLLICAITQSQQNYTLWLVRISSFAAKIYSPLWNPSRRRHSILRKMINTYQPPWHIKWLDQFCQIFCIKRF